MGRVISIASTADQAAIEALERACFGQVRAAHGIDRPFILTLAATIEPYGLVGFAQLQTVAPDAELLWTAVHPDHRRSGHGQALLRAALSEASARELERVVLEVAADNIPALALYRAAGFSRVGFRPKYYPRPGAPAVDAIILATDQRTV